MRKVEAKHRRVVQVARRRLGLTEEDYRNCLRHVAGVESSRDLDPLGFCLLMDHFEYLGFTSTARAGGWGERPGMATPAQVHYIRALWREFTDDTGSDVTLGKWIEGRFKVTALRFVPAELAPKLITALRSMNKRKAAKCREAG
jgi:Bacteriophage Mu, GemA protein